MSAKVVGYRLVLLQIKSLQFHFAMSAKVVGHRLVLLQIKTLQFHFTMSAKVVGYRLVLLQIKTLQFSTLACQQQWIKIIWFGDHWIGAAC
jgi:hypothetical protein